MTSFSRVNLKKSAENIATWTASLEGEEMEFNGKPIEFDFIGANSKEGRKAVARMVRRDDARRSKMGRKKTPKDLTEDQIISAAAQDEKSVGMLLADLCIGWRNVPFIPDEELENPDYEEQLLPYSAENAKLLFTTRSWLHSEVQDFLDNNEQHKKVVSAP